MKNTKLVTCISALAGFVMGAMAIGKYHFASGLVIKGRVTRLERYYALLNRWLQLRQNGETLDKYFTEHSYSDIAVYGMGELGMNLCAELKNSKVNVKFAVDKKIESVYSDMKLYRLENFPREKIDAIIVTPVFAYQEIKSELSNYTECPIISLEDIVFEL